MDCTPDERRIRELNSGIYCFDASWLWASIDDITVSPKGEYYLPDMVAIAVSQGQKVVTVEAPAEDVSGVNTRIHLAQAAAIMRRRILDAHMLNGVTIEDPSCTYIDADVVIGRDSRILPGVILQGATLIGANSIIGPNSQVVDSQIGDHCRITYSVVEQAIMETGSDVGPFGHIRKGSRLGEGAHMGNFGEMKNSHLGAGAKMGHFSYLGDAEIGEGTNIGAGTITCNYDGINKHPTKVGKGAFIGSDTMLVAPVDIGEGGRTGAGSVVTHDVPPGATVVGVPARVHHGSSKDGQGKQ